MSRISFAISFVTFIFVGVLHYGAAQRCDFFDEFEQCISLPTNMVCGDPGITAEQMQQIAANPQIINEIENIGGPIYENSLEAQALGISLNEPIVDLSVAQNNFYRRCDDQTILTPITELDGESDFPQRRRRRQAVDNSCCRPSPVLTRILASVSSRGNAVQVVQPVGFAQLFEDARSCPQSTNCGVTCGAILTTIPAEVIFLSPILSYGRTDIVIDICGAVADP